MRTNEIMLNHKNSILDRFPTIKNVVIRGKHQNILDCYINKNLYFNVICQREDYKVRVVNNHINYTGNYISDLSLLSAIRQAAINYMYYLPKAKEDQIAL